MNPSITSFPHHDNIKIILSKDTLSITYPFKHNGYNITFHLSKAHYIKALHGNLNELSESNSIYLRISVKFYDENPIYSRIGNIANKKVFVDYINLNQSYHSIKYMATKIVKSLQIYNNIPYIHKNIKSILPHMINYAKYFRYITYGI